MDYRSLVHDKDVAIYSDIRMIILDLRSFYVSGGKKKKGGFSNYRFLYRFPSFKVELYNMISKNMDKVTNPKGEEKPSMY